MAKDTETLKQNRDILNEMKDILERYNQGLKDADGYTEKMTKNNAKVLESLIKSRKQTGMTGKHLGKVADLGKKIAGGEIDVVKSKRMQNDLEKKLSKAKTTGMKASLRAQIKMLKGSDQATQVQKRTNFLMDSADKLTGGMASKTKGMLKHVKKVGPGFAAAGAAAGGIALVVALLVKSLKFASEIVDALGAQFGVAGTQSGKLRDNMMDASVDVISLGKGTADVVQLVDSLSSNFGVSLDIASKLPNKILDSAVAMGLSTDEGTRLFGTLMSIGNLTANQAEKLAESTYQLAAQNNVNPSAVMKDIANSSELIAKFGSDNLESLTRAAVQARQLGLSLDAVGGIAESLLDFQSSLSAEIEAQILTGKQLNLQKARELALTGDLSGMMDVVLKQLGSESEFNALNIIQRKSLSKALGVSVVQMEKLVSAQDKSVVQAKSFQNLIGSDAMSSLTSITNKFKEIGATVLRELGGPLEKALKSFEKRFFTEKNMDKVKGFIINLVDNIKIIASNVMNFVQTMLKGFQSLQSVFGITSKLINIVGLGIPKLMMGGYEFQGGDGMQSIKNNPGIDAGDVTSGPGSNTKIATKEGGIYDLKNNDDVVATPGLIDFLDNLTSSNVGNIKASAPQMESFNNNNLPSANYGVTNTNQISPTEQKKIFQEVMTPLFNGLGQKINTNTTATNELKKVQEDAPKKFGESLAENMSLSRY